VTIRNRLKVLIAEKELKEGRKLPLLTVSREIGIPYKTINSWQKNKVQRFDADIIKKMCSYFNIEPGGLLELIEEK
jgi:putative transcriptional regulator